MKRAHRRRRHRAARCAIAAARSGGASGSAKKRAHARSCSRLRGILLAAADLVDHHAALLREAVVRDRRLEELLGEEPERRLDVLVEDLEVQHHVLVAGVGVVLAAELARPPVERQLVEARVPWKSMCSAMWARPGWRPSAREPARIAIGDRRQRTRHRIVEHRQVAVPHGDAGSRSSPVTNVFYRAGATSSRRHGRRSPRAGAAATLDSVERRGRARRRGRATTAKPRSQNAGSSIAKPRRPSSTSGASLPPAASSSEIARDERRRLRRGSADRASGRAARRRRTRSNRTGCG